MVKQCCNCLKFHIKGGGWLHIGESELVTDIRATDGAMFPISHGYCPDCYKETVRGVILQGFLKGEPVELMPEPARAAA